MSQILIGHPTNQIFSITEKSPKMFCSHCFKTNHSKADCPEVICFQCGKTGHMGFACPKPNEERALVCWTCKGRDHKRNDRRCPGSRVLFCSYCFASGISTESCDCNQVNTRNLKVVKNIKDRLGERIKPNASVNQQDSKAPNASDNQNNTGAIPKARDNPPKKKMTTLPCALSVKIGAQEYSAVVDPSSKISWVNPEIVYIKEYNGIDHFIRTSAVIHEIERDITFETDTATGKFMILGADAIMAFGIQMMVGGRDIVKVHPTNCPMILKKPSATKANLSLSHITFKHPINLSLALPSDDELTASNMRGIPMGEFLDKISDVLDEDEDTSSNEGERRPHPNRRLYRH